MVWRMKTMKSRLKLEFHGFMVTSDAGLLACPELDEAPGLTVLGNGEMGHIISVNASYGITGIGLSVFWFAKDRFHADAKPVRD